MSLPLVVTDNTTRHTPERSHAAIGFQALHQRIVVIDTRRFVAFPSSGYADGFVADAGVMKRLSASYTEAVPCVVLVILYPCPA